MDGDPLDPLAAVDWPVITERLLLRRATAVDAEPTWRIRSLPAVYEWITSAPATLAEHAERFVLPSSLAVTVMIERDHRVIGDLMVRPDDPWAQREVREQARGVQVEIGWTLHPDEAGFGYATEAVRAMLDLCFEPMGLRRVVAGCFADNTASWRLMERVGMRREEHSIRSELHRSGRWLDAYAYAILRDEWTPSGA